MPCLQTLRSISSSSFYPMSSRARSRSQILRWGPHKRRAIRLVLLRIDDFLANKTDLPEKNLAKNYMAFFRRVCEEDRLEWESRSGIQSYTAEILRNHVRDLFILRKDDYAQRTYATGPSYIVHGSRALPDDVLNAIKGDQTEEFSEDDSVNRHIPASPSTGRHTPATDSFSPSSILEPEAINPSGRKRYASQAKDLHEELSHKRRMTSDTRDDDVIEKGMKCLSDSIAGLVEDYFGTAPDEGLCQARLPKVLDDKPSLHMVWAAMFGCQAEQLADLARPMTVSSMTSAGHLSASEVLQALVGTYFTHAIFLGNREESKWSTARDMTGNLRRRAESVFCQELTSDGGDSGAAESFVKNDSSMSPVARRNIYD